MNIANRSVKLLWIFIFNTESDVRLETTVSWLETIVS